MKFTIGKTSLLHSLYRHNHQFQVLTISRLSNYMAFSLLLHKCYPRFITNRWLTTGAEPIRSEFAGPNAYELLGVSETSSFDEIKNSFRKLAKETHPDLAHSTHNSKDTLKARAQSAKTATKVSEMLGNVNTSSALSAFERMEEKVLTMESQADALNQLTSDELEGKFALLETSSVDDDLASLKKELSGSAKKGDLPPGRTPVTRSSSPLQFQDSEIEKELNELRRRANDF